MVECQLLDLFDFLGKKWSYPLLSNINSQPMTFNQMYALSKHLINPTLLSQRLKEMMKMGLIEKEEGERITYKLTHKGIELKEILQNLKNWCEQSNFKIPQECKNKECVCNLVFSGIKIFI